MKIPGRLLKEKDVSSTRSGSDRKIGWSVDYDLVDYTHHHGFSTGFAVADFVELERHARFRFIVRGKVRDVRGQRILKAGSLIDCFETRRRASFVHACEQNF